MTDEPEHLELEEVDFVKITGFPHELQKAVMPVVAYRNNQIRLLGTCFAVSDQGLVITARHVLDEAINIMDWSSGTPDDPWWVGALYISEPSIGDDVADLFGGIIQANKIHINSNLDIGVMHLNLPRRITDNEPIPMPAFGLSPALPRAGDHCSTAGYHNMKSGALANTHTITQSFSASSGVIEEIHFPYRDKSSLSFPCFRTSSRFDSGMSGAPIFGENGYVIGVVCSSFELFEKQGYISYGSLIGPAFFLLIDATEGQVFLYDFVSGGAIKTDETIKQLNVHRQANILEINFGISPVFRGETSEAA